MSNGPYHWCVVPNCKNTSIKTPGKLWIKVPTEINKRTTWLKLAKRDPKLLSYKTSLYFCEDHFDLENDMENYTRYKIMGSVKRIVMKPHCMPSRFDYQADRKLKSAQCEPQLYQADSKLSTPCEPQLDFIKVESKTVIKEEETEDNLCLTDNVEESSFCSEDYLHTETNNYDHQNKYNKAVQVSPIRAHKSIQVSHMALYRSKKVQHIRKKDAITSSYKSTLCTATSFCQTSEAGANKQCTCIQPTVNKSTCNLHADNSDSDGSHAPSIAGSTVGCDSSLYKLSNPLTTSETSSQDEYEKIEKLNLQSTMFKIKNKPKLYIGIPKDVYFVIDLINKYTNISEHNILLCLMKIKLNKTFAQLADDFEVSVAQAKKVFFNGMPEIVKVLSPFIKQFSYITIKKNLPFAFRHKYNNVTCIIDCFEVKIQKPTKAIHRALTWSDYKKTNTIKYLIAYTPDGLVSFVSNGYAGRISDMNLLEDSKFLECVQPGAYILAARGFKHFEQFFNQKGYILLRPPSVAVGFKFSKTEMQQTKQICSLRIHVQRVIGRLRQFGMLKLHSVLHPNLIGMLDLCITTACALINLQDDLIKEIICK